MCHGFLAVGDSGERLSHAVGCAFAICLERKQMREKVENLPIYLYRYKSNRMSIFCLNASLTKDLTNYNSLTDMVLHFSNAT